MIPSHATLRKFRSAGPEAVKGTRLGVCFRDILRLYSPFLVADASARQRAEYSQQHCLSHGATLPLTQSLDVSAIFVSEMWILELKISSTHDSRGRSIASIGEAWHGLSSQPCRLSGGGRNGSRRHPGREGSRTLRDRRRYRSGRDRPGAVLASMVKRTDVAVETVVKDYANGKFPGGKTVTLGLPQGGVGLSHLRTLLRKSIS